MFVKRFQSKHLQNIANKCCLNVVRFKYFKTFLMFTGLGMHFDIFIYLEVYVDFNTV